MRKILLLAALVALTGCSSVDYEQLGSGYISVTHTRTSWEPPASDFVLKYSPGGGKPWSTVWPDLAPSHIMVKDGVAVFLGKRTSGKQKHFYAAWPTDDRLFAVRAPDPPLDITAAILSRWCVDTGREFKEIQQKRFYGLLDVRTNPVTLHFAVEGHASADYILDWNQITNIIREGKENGVARKDLHWGTRYIEVQK